MNFFKNYKLTLYSKFKATHLQSTHVADSLIPFTTEGC